MKNFIEVTPAGKIEPVSINTLYIFRLRKLTTGTEIQMIPGGEGGSSYVIFAVLESYDKIKALIEAAQS